MPSILDQWQESQKGAALFGKVKCPINYVLKPGHDPFLSLLTGLLSLESSNYVPQRADLIQGHPHTPDYTSSLCFPRTVSRQYK